MRVVCMYGSIFKLVHLYVLCHYCVRSYSRTTAGDVSYKHLLVRKDDCTLNNVVGYYYLVHTKPLFFARCV